MQTNLILAHFAIEFGLWDKRGDGVDDDKVDGTALGKHLADLKGLLTGIRLRKYEFVDVDAKFGSVFWVNRVLGIDEGGASALLLRLCDRVQG